MKSINRELKTCAETLIGISVFKNLTNEQRRELAALYPCRLYQAGQKIISYSDSGRDVYFVVSGQVQATVFSMTGKQIILNDLRPGDMFGELAAIDSQPRSAYVVATAEALIWSMPAATFWQVLQRYPAVTEATLKHLSAMIRQLCGRVVEITTLPVKSRVEIELLRLALQQSAGSTKVVITPAPTHSDIANYIGTHREAVSREMARLRKRGFIERRHNALIVVDLERLRALVREATGEALPQAQAG
jgi:CRP-like cAMP-binding protein